jgi:hypothetical protein
LPALKTRIRIMSEIQGSRLSQATSVVSRDGEPRENEGPETVTRSRGSGDADARPSHVSAMPIRARRASPCVPDWEGMIHTFPRHRSSGVFESSFHFSSFLYIQEVAIPSFCGSTYIHLSLIAGLEYQPPSEHETSTCSNYRLIVSSSRSAKRSRLKAKSIVLHLLSTELQRSYCPSFILNWSNIFFIIPEFDDCYYT